MDDRTARGLIALDNRFYAEHAASFSATRQAPWPGWTRTLGIAWEAGVLARQDGRPIRILDLACGNLRFERFLASTLPCAEIAGIEFHAVDDCEPLARAAAIPGLAFHRVDVLADLLDGRDPLTGIPRCDLVACFGFMHHVPGARLRAAVLASLLRATAPEGIIALSFWQFMRDERLARKACEADARSGEALRQAGADPDGLEIGDHFLGWQDDAGALRYCHHFTDLEIDALAAVTAPGAREIARFSADGRRGDLNRYLILQRRR